MFRIPSLIGAGLFLGGVAFGTAGVKLLSSKDAKNAYAHCTAAALRVKDSVMQTVTTIQENAEDILAEAKAINQERAENTAEPVVEDAAVEAAEETSVAEEAAVQEVVGDAPIYGKEVSD